MVKIALQITCRLDNIEELRPSESEFRWCLKFTCCNCGKTSDKWHYVCSDDPVPMSVRRSGVNHFVSKCKLCSRENYMMIIEDSVESFTEDDQGQFKTIVIFDCRGIEPSDFSAREGWVAKATGGKEFDEIDLSEGEWEDYCDKTMQPVGIYEIKHKFERIK